MAMPDAWRGNRSTRKITREAFVVAPLVALMTVGVYFVGAVVSIGVALVGLALAKRNR